MKQKDFYAQTIGLSVLRLLLTDNISDLNLRYDDLNVAVDELYFIKRAEIESKIKNL